ncbi:MAG TPA: MFS transporter [Chloroflexota bacterium]
MRARATLFLPVYVPTFLLSLGQGMLVPTLPLHAQSFADSFSLISLVIAAAGVGALVANVPAGVMLNRIGRRRAMLIGTISIAASTFAIGLATIYPELVLYRFVTGVGTSLWNISRMAFLAESTTPAERGRALSTFGGVSRIGTFAGPAIGGGLGYLYGLQAPFFASALLALAASVVSLLYVRDTSGTAHLSRQARWSALGSTARLHWRELSTAGAAQVFVQMIRAGRQIIVPLYGASVLRLSVAEIGTVVSISAAIDMSLFIPAGLIMDRMGRKWATVPSFTIMAIGMALIPLSSGFLGLLIATAVIGVGNGMSSGTMMTLGADLAPPEATGEFMGVWRLIGDLGSTGGPVIVGGVADLVGLAAAAFTLTGVGIIAAATLALFVRETLHRGRAPAH